MIFARVQEKIKVPPRQEQRLRMTYEEFLAWADEDVHAEWEDGEVIIFMPPKTRHQDIATFLATLLRLFVDFFRLGEVLTALFEMKATPNSPAREPDILFVAREHQDRLTEDRLEGPADLIVEFISDDSVHRDRVRKFYEYQGAGVGEWGSTGSSIRAPGRSTPTSGYRMKRGNTSLGLWGRTGYIARR